MLDTAEHFITRRYAGISTVLPNIFDVCRRDRTDFDFGFQRLAKIRS